MTDFKCTDLGNAERFETFYGDTAKFIREKGKWVFWTRSGWQFADIFKLSKPVVRNIAKEASECPEDKRTVELLTWAKSSENKSFQRNMLDLAAAQMSINLDKFDANPRVINCLNGVVDLRTKTLIPHSPSELHLNCANAKYDPKAKCDRWLRFLYEVFEDQALIDWLQVSAGYSIMGLTTEHLFFLCYGNGRNGKGTFLETIAHVLGSYSHMAEFDTFLQKDQSSVRVLEAKGRLKGRRFAMASETSSSIQFNSVLIKNLTGGDTLVGTELNRSAFSFLPTHTLWFACNDLPPIKDASIAMWERVKTIPFGKNFLDEEQEKHLKETLRKEANGIFLWLVEGAHKYLEDGRLSPMPERCVEATNAYRDANDKLSIFKRDCLVFDVNSKVGVEDCYNRYIQWCKETRTPKEFDLNGSFSTEMAKRGVSRTNKGNEGRKFISYRFSENSQKEMITLPSVAHVTNIVAPSPLWEDIKNMVSYNLS